MRDGDFLSDDNDGHTDDNKDDDDDGEVFFVCVSLLLSAHFRRLRCILAV